MKSLKFIHITKTAGTSIEEAALNIGIFWGRYDNEYTKGKIPDWHKPFHLLDKEIKQKYDWFMVVRNPYERIVSEFYCKWIYPKNKDVSIEEYNLIIRANINARKIQNLGYHYTEQHLYLDKDSNITIIKFENLCNEFYKLMKKYNINIQLDKLNIGQKKYSTKHFDKKTVDLIKCVYEKDFVAFNYEKDII